MLLFGQGSGFPVGVIDLVSQGAGRLGVLFGCAELDGQFEGFDLLVAGQFVGEFLVGRFNGQLELGGPHAFFGGTLVIGFLERLGFAWVVRTVFGFLDFDDFIATGAGHVHELALESFDVFARRIDTSKGHGDIAGGCQFAVPEIFPFAASFLPDEFGAFIEDAFFFDGFAVVHLPERSVAKEQVGGLFDRDTGRHQLVGLFKPLFSNQPVIGFTVWSQSVIGFGVETLFDEVLVKLFIVSEQFAVLEFFVGFAHLGSDVLT